METRTKVTTILIILGIILAVLPLTSHRSFIVTPEKVLTQVMDSQFEYSVDQVAKLIINDDSTLQLIDLRSPEEFNKISIPGSVNVPYKDFINSDLYIYLNNSGLKNVFYSNGDLYSNYALVYARGLGYKNTFVMKGGLSEWYKTVLNSKFKGERISPRENSIFEIRTKAARLFNQFNSMPDSLKASFMTSSKFSARKLDGGCE